VNGQTYGLTAVVDEGLVVAAGSAPLSLGAPPEHTTQLIGSGRKKPRAGRGASDQTMLVRRAPAHRIAQRIRQ